MLLVFFFTFFNLFSSAQECRECKTIVHKSSSYISHFLDQHHETSDECFFCDKKSNAEKISNYVRHGKHLQEEHTGFIIGLYRYYFDKEPLSSTIKRWNDDYLARIFNGEDSVYSKKFQCSDCNVQISGVCALYHFVAENWDYYKICNKCHTSSIPSNRKKCATKDFLAVIAHSRKCGFDAFNKHFINAFPDLQLLNDKGSLSVIPRVKPVNHTLLSLDGNLNPIELYPEIYLCNKLVDGKICNKALIEHQVAWHVAAHICAENSSTMQRRTCSYCNNFFDHAYFFHLIEQHKEQLHGETLKLVTPPAEMITNCND